MSRCGAGLRSAGVPLSAAILLTMFSGCAYYGNYETVSSNAGQIANTTHETVQSDRQTRLQRLARELKAERKQDDEGSIREELRTKFPDLSKLSLTEALQIATAHNRDFSNERDSNISSGLSYLQARHLFDPRLSGTLGFLHSWAKNTGVDTDSRSLTATGSLGVDYLTTLGTKIRADVGTINAHEEQSGATDNAGSAKISIAQPLLRGAGRTVNREPLTLAERNLTYRLRQFELYREDFTIEGVSRFYDLVREKQVIGNNRQRFEQVDFLFRRAQSLSKMGRAKELDVLQAEQERLTAENNLRDAEENYKDSLLTFKTFLGVPDDVALDIRTDEFPEFRKVQLDSEKAVQLAYACRLDLATAEEQVEDAKRGVTIAHNGQLPDLSLALSAGSNAAAGAHFNRQVFDDHAAAAGVTFTMPLDRLDQHVAAKQAELNLDRVQRNYKQFRDTLASDVRRQLRNLLRNEQSMVVQRKIVSAAEKRLANAELLFRQGTRTSRDVVEAQQDLLRARNDDIQFVVDHVIAELRFQRALGVLIVAPTGLPQPSELFGPPEKRAPPEKPAQPAAEDAEDQP